MTRRRILLPRVQATHDGGRIAAFFRRSIVRRGGVLLSVALVILVLAPSSSAEFETPYIDSSNGVNNAEFRGVWAVNRGYDNFSGPDYNGYEAFAVGIDADNDGSACTNTNKANCNGILYFYNGSTWSRVLKPFVGTTEVFSLNGVAGTIDGQWGSLNYLWVVGADGKIGRMNGYWGTIGTVSNQIIYDPAYSPEDEAPIPRDFYSIDAVQEYNELVLAGGQGGLVAYTRFNQNFTTLPTLPTPGGISTAESVTGIVFTNNTTAYVTTSEFALVGGERESPYAHNCPAGATARLYKVQFSGDVPNFGLPVITSPNNCFYGLAQANKPNLNPAIWVASQSGIYRYDSDTGASVVSNAGTPYYSVVAINQRSGAGTNLLNNGDFETSTTTSGWVKLQMGAYYLNSAGVCTSTTSNFLTVPLSGGADGSNHYFKVINQGIFKTSACDFKYPTGLTVGIFQPIPFSIIEGQRYKVSGYYKVEFPNNSFTTDPNYTTETKYAQGGVVIACGGSNVQSELRTVDCSVDYRKLMRLKEQGDTTLVPGNIAGWVYFETIISREDEIFKNIIKQGGVQVTQNKMDFRVQCEGTYGATVSCDQLKVEAVDEPSVQPHEGVLVIAAGKDLGDNGIAINENALNSPVYQAEAIPGKIMTDRNLGFASDVNAMFALGSQHIYAVGRGYQISPDVTKGLAIFNRTPSTLRGTIQTGLSGAGSISVSCVDDRGLNGTLTKSLCERVPESYGVSLEITSTASVQKTGHLTGRGWFGKTADAQESLDLGMCVGSVNPDPAVYTMNYTNVNANSCDTAVRRCREYNPDGSLTSTRVCSGDNTTICTVSSFCSGLNLGYCTPKVLPIPCLTNFDCLGRCQKDSGFVCLKNDDCRLGPNSTSTANTTDWTSGGTAGRFSIAPGSRLTCGALTNNILASPLACRPTGWLSFNASDFPAGYTTPPSGVFGVQFNTKYVNVCAGDITKHCDIVNTCAAQGVAGPCYTHNSVLTDIPNQGGHELAGWGRFMSMAAGHCSTSATNPADRGKSCQIDANCIDVAGSYCVPGTGWVNFRGPIWPVSPAKINGVDSLFGCYNCAGISGLGGDKMNCAFCRDAIGQSCTPGDPETVSACFNVCKDNPTKHCATNSDCGPQGASGPCITPGACSIPTNAATQTFKFCTNTDPDCAGYGTCILGTMCKSAGSQCTTYGLNLDTTTGNFKGNAWSEDFGWLDFGQANYGGTRILQTKLGDVYSTGPIGDSTVAVPGAGSCNATYLITSASTITGFCSSALATDVIIVNPIQPNSSSLPLLSAANSYQNILGRFDLTGIEKDVGGGKNKYGSNITTLVASGGSLASAAAINDFDGAIAAHGGRLDGAVYTIGTAGDTTNYSLDLAMFFANGSAAGQSGAGILIVNGNLTINENMVYTNNPALGGDIRRLASLTVVVRGDLTIKNQVEELVGAYYVTGKVNTATDDISTNQYKLVVHGLMIAKEFNFVRKFAGTITTPAASELIIYDGRLQSNPLPGMTDFASALPNSVSLNR